MNHITKCACYVRVSTENQLENYSIEEQIDRLTAYCKAKDLTIIKFYTDGGFSGGNLNRPALQNMLTDIDCGMVDCVVVYKLDRLSRSQKDTLMLIEDKFIASNVNFISISENFDTSTPFGRAMIGILSVFAQLEKDQITDRFTMGRIGRAKNGFFHGGAYAPVGYDYVDGELVINEYEALQVNELYARFSKGYPLHNCWQHMKEKYTTKYGSWSSETLVRNVLKNEVYIGKVKFKGQIYDGVHDPIISLDLFQAVQDIFNNCKRDKSVFKRSPFKASTLLSGLLYCGNCGARYHGEHGNYSCYSRTKGDPKYVVDPDCKNKKWKIPELDALVIDHLSEIDFDSLKRRPRNIKPKRDYRGRISEIDKQVTKLIDLYQIGSIPIDTISSKINALTAEKEALETESSSSDDEYISNSELIGFRDQFFSLLDDGSLEEKRACLACFVERITVTQDAIEISIK